MIQKIFINKFYSGFLKSSLGRSRGKIVTGGRCKSNNQLYRVIDKFRLLKNRLNGMLVIKIEKNPLTNYFIALVYYIKLGIFSYIVCVENLTVGSVIYNSNYFNTMSLPFSFSILKKYLKPGCSLNLINIPVSSNVSLINNTFGGFSKFVVAAGTAAKILRKVRLISGLELVGLILPSGSLKFFDSLSCATLGRISNSNYHLKMFNGAGYTFYNNFKPHVRGVAKNPVDHPHGGGEGKTSGGRISVTAKGRLTKGKKTISFKLLKKKKKYTLLINRGLIF